MTKKLYLPLLMAMVVALFSSCSKKMGELLIDFTPAGVSETGMCLYERNPGGAPVNMLTAAAKAGLRTAFIGKVGKDRKSVV